MIECIVCNGSSTEPVLNRNGFDLVKCRYDGHLYISNPPSATEVGKIYTREYFEGNCPVGYHHNVFASPKKQIAKAQRKLERIISHTASGRLLDVGAGPGFFLHLADKHYAAEGIDLSYAAVDYARLEFGASITQARFEDFSSEGGKYSIITMWSVLEHMLDPRENLMHANRLLQEDGLLAISFPNAFGITRYVKGKDWRGFQFPEHLHFFSNRNLIRLLRETGFDPLHMKLKDNNFFRDTCYILARKKSCQVKSINLP
jgi:SAM-dependent methyltransferase